MGPLDAICASVAWGEHCADRPELLCDLHARSNFEVGYAAAWRLLEPQLADARLENDDSTRVLINTRNRAAEVAAELKFEIARLTERLAAAEAKAAALVEHWPVYYEGYESINGVVDFMDDSWGVEMAEHAGGFATKVEAVEFYLGKMRT
jgi:hypothetical protein